MSVKTYQKGKNVRLSENFQQRELDCQGVHCCRKTKIDDALIAYLQKIRTHFGKPVTVNSGYRCATHNKEVGGVSGSYHVRGMAADIVVKGISPSDVAKYAEHMGVRGIGLYDTFTHIDTRGRRSFWYSHQQSARSTFGGRNPYAQPSALQQYGSCGTGVKWCQWELNFCGYPCGAVDGIAGVKFKKAVIAFQKANGLQVDGIVGPATRAALKAW